jgi:hypothetical protein
VVVLVAGALGAGAPAAGAASTFTVEGTGDGAKSVPGAECETTAGECTLRAAIEAADVASDRDTIKFDPSFAGEGGPAIVLGSPLPAVTEPLRIDATPCEPGQGPPFPCVPVSAPAGSPGIDLEAGGSAVEGLILSGAEPGIRIAGAAAGSLIEGNLIRTPPLSGGATGILVLNGPNQVYGNEIEGACCSSGIRLAGAAEGNRIGGDTARSENVIDGFQAGAISIALAEGSRNEVGRNRGSGGGEFIGLFKADAAEPGLPNQIGPPAIGQGFLAGAAGSAEPGATVRVFRKAGTGRGELAGFLAAATADGAGEWRASFAAVPAGTPIAATQTRGGGTSELSAVAVAAPEPPPGDDGGGGGGAGAGTGPGAELEGPVDRFAPPPVPRARITAGPARRSRARAARFRFTSSVPGARFECRLDGRGFARCRSPRAYRHLRPGRHVFRVRAIGAGGRGTVARWAFRVLR